MWEIDVENEEKKGERGKERDWWKEEERKRRERRHLYYAGAPFECSPSAKEVPLPPKKWLFGSKRHCCKRFEGIMVFAQPAATAIPRCLKRVEQEEEGKKKDENSLQQLFFK